MSNDSIPEMETSVSIRDAILGTAALYFKVQTPKEREEENLTDKKALWLFVVQSKKPQDLSERDKAFIERFKKENLMLSPFWQYKPEIRQFLDTQKVKYGVK